MVEQLTALGIVSLIAHLEHNAVMWLVAAAMSIFIGFYWFDDITTNLGLAFGLCFLVYGLACFSIAFRNMLSHKEEE